MNKCWALLEGEFLYCVVFDEDLAHEIAMEYDFTIEEMADEIEWVQGGTVN